MANHHDLSGSGPDPRDEAQLEELLKSGYAGPEPSAEFQKALFRQLDQAFVRMHQSEPAADLLATPSLNSAIHEKKSLAAGAEKLAVAVPNETAPPPRQSVSLRMALTMAVAASLLLVVSLWHSQSAYGWAAMMRALENCGWVQAVSQTTGLSGWVSSERGVVAIRSEGEVAYHDQSEQTFLRYVADRQVIHQQALPTGGSSPGPAEFMRLLLQAGPNALPNQQVDGSSFKVVSESWRRVEPRAGREASVELRVALNVLGSQKKPVKLLFVLNPETHLPKSCRLLATDRAAAKSFDFTYPADGPNSIFALGIPRETVVVASLANFDGEPPTGSREAVDSRFLRRSVLDREAEEKENKSTRLKSTLLAAKPKEPKADARGANKKNVDKSSTDKKIVQAIPDSTANKTIQADQIVTSPPVVADGFEAADTRIASNPPRPMRELPAPVLPERVLALQELVERVNNQLAVNWQAQGMTAAERASDTEFLRRVYLDLTGRIPMVDEVYRFLDDESQDRREHLVEELLLSRDHATHLATVWRSLLLPEGVNTASYGGTAKFDEWLADRFEKNLPYDQLVRQLLLAEGRVSDSGPILFYAALKLNPEELAAKTARTFLGMRMECAQCHDHKFDDTISQEDFWGFAAHFAQISRPQGKMDMTSSVLRVRDNHRGEVMLPDTDEVVPPRLPYLVRSEKVVAQSGTLNIGNSNGTLQATTKTLSRRELLVDWLITKQNSRFAKATVNRVWQHMFGLGLVEPVDDMRADNPAVCPEVLETLSLDFAASGYDLRRLLRTLVLSDAYQLSSRSDTDEPSQGLAFARMNIKSFTADQLYDCISVATEYEAMRNGNAAEGALARFGNSSRQAFIEQFRAPPGHRTDYHAGIPQALTLMHGFLIHGATDLSSSGLLKSLSAPFFTDEQRIETLFLSTLSRYPEQAEQEIMLEYVQAASSDEERSRALGDILWALLNSAEFTFIH